MVIGMDGLDYRDNKSIWFERMLDQGIMAASYKAFWLKGIIEEVVHNDRAVIPFEAIVNRMIVNAWFPIVKFRLSFGYSDKLGETIDYINRTYGFGPEIKKDRLFRELEFSEELLADRELRKRKKNFFNLVPYRLISPFFRDRLRGLPDWEKNRLIEAYSLEDESCFYSVSQADKTISIRKEWMEYIRRNQALVIGWLQNKLVMYIEAKNPNVPNVLFKMEAPMARKLSAATKYWKEFLDQYPTRDIYTGEMFGSENYEIMGILSIDHFIPWSFVLHDENWNLTPTFRNVNSSKSDSLPQLDRYLDEFCKLQYRAIRHMKESSGNQKLLESYYNISHGRQLEEILVKGLELEEDAFCGNLKDTIVPVYQIARNSGFEVWEIRKSRC